MKKCKHGENGRCVECLKEWGKEVTAKQPDPVNHPSHYTGGKVECIDALEAATVNLTGGKVECIDALEAATVNLTGIEAVRTANVIKYLWRWKQKNGVEDLKKAKWYLDHLIKQQEGKDDGND